MYTTPLALLFTVLVGIAYALPPFEIRSGHGPRSEAATQWVRHLQKQNTGCRGDGSERLCPSAYPAKRCILSEQVCDGVGDCPEEEDENPTLCSFLTLNARYRNGKI